MATKIQLLTGWICSTTDFYFWGKGAVVEELQKNNECMIEELYRKMPEKEEVLYFYYAVHKPGKCERQIKEKLKEILKKNYGITSDAELLKELNDMESVDLGIFVTQINTEKTA